MNIKLQCQTTTTHLSWEYNTDIGPSDYASALQYAKSHARDFIGCRWFMALYVWDMDSEKLIGEIRLGEPEVMVRKSEVNHGL